MNNLTLVAVASGTTATTPTDYNYQVSLISVVGNYIDTAMLWAESRNGSVYLMGPLSIIGFIIGFFNPIVGAAISGPAFILWQWQIDHLKEDD